MHHNKCNLNLYVKLSVAINFLLVLIPVLLTLNNKIITELFYLLLYSLVTKFPVTYAMNHLLKCQKNSPLRSLGLKSLNFKMTEFKKF